MKHLILSLALGASLLAPSAFACEGEDHSAAGPSKVSVQEMASLKREKKATPIDANGASTREKYGVIPGAVLLTSSSNYEMKELPADKNAKLVFYRASEKCSASHTAAKRAPP